MANGTATVGASFTFATVSVKTSDTLRFSRSVAVTRRSRLPTCASSGVPLKVAVAACLLIGVLGGGAGFLTFHSFAKSPIDTTGDEASAVLPEDPQTEVVTFDLHGGFPSPQGKEPYLTIRGDGMAVFGNSYGDSRKIEMRLSHAELQGFVRFAVNEQDFFHCDSAALAEAVRSETARKGLPAGVKDLPTAILRIKAAGREHEVRCAALGDALA